MAATLSVRPNRPAAGSPFPWPPFRRSGSTFLSRTASWSGGAAVAPPPRRAFTRTLLLPVQATSRPDDSAPSKMSLEHALKLLGVSEGASFDEILRAKNSILATCSDDKAIAQVEAAYDMLLMQSLTRRRAGKVENSRIRYADAKPINSPGLGSSSQWLRNMPITVEAPSTRDLGIQAGVYGALAVLTYVNGASSSSSLPYAGADVPGLILAGSFGASLYFMTKRNVKLGKATVITLGGLVAGAVVGSAVESWLQVDVVPFLGVHSPATVVPLQVLFIEITWDMGWDCLESYFVALKLFVKNGPPPQVPSCSHSVSGGVVTMGHGFLRSFSSALSALQNGFARYFSSLSL